VGVVECGKGKSGKIGVGPARGMFEISKGDPAEKAGKGKKVRDGGVNDAAVDCLSRKGELEGERAKPAR